MVFESGRDWCCDLACKISFNRGRGVRSVFYHNSGVVDYIDELLSSTF